MCIRKESAAWRKIWENRKIDESLFKETDVNTLFAGLKKCNGFDVVGGIPLESLLEQYSITKKTLLSFAPDAGSIFEVGCGSGANLLLFERDGWTVGGLDYSKTLIETAASVLHTDDLTYSPASGLSVEPCYDCLLSNSVFSYFPDHEYAEIVLDKMCRKANYAVILFDIHDVGKKDDFIAYRRSIIEDYEERYRDLGKLFYDRSFFEKAASRNNMSIEFIEYSMNGYWNNEFVFNLIMYKNNQEKCNMAG